MDYNSIIKYLQGAASENEKNEILGWIEESPENKQEYISLKKAWAITSRGNENEKIAWKDLVQRQNQSRKKKKVLYPILKKAAIFILLFGLGSITHYFISNNKESELPVYTESFNVKAPLGQMTNLELPDGTVVLLNSGSSISYHGDFSYGNRQVTLKGEAFFDVSKDADHPFIVKSPLLDVKVYGTSFNIQAYPEDESFNATLVEGSISMLDKTGREVTLLKPGEKAFYNNKQAKLIVSQVDTEMYTSWKEGLITFRNVKLKDIAKRIERWYNIEIQIKNSDLGEEAYFGSILKNKPIDQILEVFKLTTSLQYEIVPRADKPTLIYWK